MRSLVLATLLLCVHISFSQSIIYVSPTGSGDTSGSSWANALPGTLLANRIATASAGTQFWLVSGTYKPTTTTDRTASFSITSGITLYGGFQGGETDPSQRNSFVETQLSGNIGNVDDSADNSLQVVRILNVNGTVTLDRMAVVDGRVVPPSVVSSGAGVSIEATDCQTTVRLIGSHFVRNRFSPSLNGGGAVFAKANTNAVCQLWVSDCFFADNTAGFGGALCLYTEGGTISAHLENTQFRQNTATEGGAISAKYAGTTPGSSFTIRNCLFINNTATLHGGAIATGGLSPELNACRFQNNAAPNGGAIDAANSKCRFTNCLFSQNRANSGGVVAGSGGSAPVNAAFINCTFVDNDAATNGGVADITSGFLSTTQRNTIRFANCISWRNTAPTEPFLTNRVVENGFAAVATVTYSLIQGGFAGVGNLNTNPIFAGGVDDSRYRLQPTSPAINAGDPNTEAIGLTDVGSNSRISGGRIDIGAFEYQCTGLPCPPLPDPSPIIYVSQFGSGDNSGSSWSNALPGTLFPSRVATAAPGTQFWLTGGTYLPTTTLDRTASFSIASGVSVYGGFLGNEQSIYERTYQNMVYTHASRLSGYLDLLIRSMHVVRVTNTTQPVILDGLTIAEGSIVAGDYEHSGVGIYVEQHIPAPFKLTLSTCRIEANNTTNTFGTGAGLCVYTTGAGSGTLAAYHSRFLSNQAGGFGGAFGTVASGGALDVLFDDCEFMSNTGGNGGGAIDYPFGNSQYNLTINQCRFSNNGAGFYGGAITAGGPSLRVDNSTFVSNWIYQAPLFGGGGAVNTTSADATFRNCLFYTNTAHRGGAVASSSSFRPTHQRFINCTFALNQATQSGGAFYTDIMGGDPTKTTTNMNQTELSHCIVWANAAPNSPAFFAEYTDRYSSRPLTTFSLIQDYNPIQYIGVGNWAADPLFVDVANRNFRLNAKSPAIDAGSTNPMAMTSTDLDQQPRLRGLRIDLGAYEAPCPDFCAPFMVRRAQ